MDDVTDTRGISAEMVAELMAEGAMVRRHPSGSCALLRLMSGPPTVMLDCRIMDQLVAEGTVLVDDRGVYRLCSN